MKESELFESILLISSCESSTFYEEPDVPGFDVEDGLIGLDGKFKKFYKPDMTYDIRNNHIVDKENILKNRY